MQSCVAVLRCGPALLPPGLDYNWYDRHGIGGNGYGSLSQLGSGETVPCRAMRRRDLKPEVRKTGDVEPC